MHFEWAVVLGAFVVIIVFVAWVVRRAETPDSHDNSPMRPRAADESRPESRPPATHNPLHHAEPEPEAPLESHPEIVRKFHALLLTDSAGAPIGSHNRAAWLQARRNGVTATDVGKIVKLNGHFSEQRAGLLDAKLRGQEAPFLPVFQHGIDREPIIAAWVAETYAIQPNSLLCRGENPRHLATPDGIGAGVIAEIKTSSRPLDQTLGTYRDQLQWQLHVTRSERLLFVVENRFTFRRETCWVERDDYRILILAAHADAFILDLDNGRATIQTTIGTPARKTVAEPSNQLGAAVKTSSILLPPASASKKAPAAREALYADEDDTRIWSDAERERLLAAYSRDASIAELARKVGATDRAIVFELSRLLLEPQGPMVDPTAKRFGLLWDSADETTIRDLHSDGVSLPDIARKIQRDQLGVAFRLFENHIPQLPALPTPGSETLEATSSVAPELPVELRSEPTDAGRATPALGPDIAEIPRPDPHRPGIVAIRRQEVLVPPETIVGGLDPDNDSDDNRAWSRPELRQLVSLYCDNEDVDISDLARHLRTTSRAVVIALAEIILEPQGQLENPHYPKRDWTQGDVDAVHDLFRAGATLHQIARSVGRDQLSVAFRLLGDRLPETSGFVEEFAE